MPLQVDMFSGELVDARSRIQKSRNREASQPKQTAMFSARETVQLGVSARPWLKDLARPTLTLEVQDLRTDEEKERDRWREAEALTTPMFVNEDSTHDTQPVNGDQMGQAGEGVSQAIVEALPGDLRHIGFRACARRASVPVRWAGERGF